jgi:hypothetical protein
LSADEKGVDVHAEILACVGQGQELKELRVVQEEKSTEDEALLLQKLVDFLLKDLEVHRHLLEDLDPRVDHQIVDGLGVLVAGPHDSLELQPGVDELLGGIAEDVAEDGAVVNDVQVDPVSLCIDPYLKILMHGLQFVDPGQDVLLDVGGELALGDHLQGVQILLDGLIQGLSVDQDVGVLGVLEGDYLELEFLPLVTDAQEYCLVLGLGVCVLDDLMDVLLVVLNVVFPQVDDGELVLRLQMGSLDEIKDLHPVSIL